MVFGTQTSMLSAGVAPQENKSRIKEPFKVPLCSLLLVINTKREIETITKVKKGMGELRLGGGGERERKTNRRERWR